MEFVSLGEFHRRKLRPGEALSVFVHDAKKLLDQAMPKLEKNAREQLLLHQFLGGLPETISRQLRATGEVKTLDTAIARARLLMTIDEPERAPNLATLLCNFSCLSVLWYVRLAEYTPIPIPRA